MKVWEAQQILEGLDPNVEVMLTIGNANKSKDFPPVPRYEYYPPAGQPYWVVPKPESQFGDH